MDRFCLVNERLGGESLGSSTVRATGLGGNVGIWRLRKRTMNLADDRDGRGLVLRSNL